MKKGIAFFDFDGTITTKDTLLEFIKYSKGRWRFYFGFLLLSPFLFAYKLKIITNQAAKEKVLQFYFKGADLKGFNRECNDFADKVLRALIRPAAIQQINNHLLDNTEVVIVSASPENWIIKWADSMKIKLIATMLEVQEEKITGKIAGKNCYGKEKVKRIRESYDLDAYNNIFAYGDSNGDIPMLALSKEPQFKPFR